MRTLIGWRTLLVLAMVAGLLLSGIDDLTDQDRLALGNLLVLVCFGGAWMAGRRVLQGERPWQRGVQAWMARPMTHWNDWRVIGLLAGIAFGFYFLGIVDLPPGDKWSSAGVLLLLALCLAVQMINVAFLKGRGRK
jgi:hypothetical protein